MGRFLVLCLLNYFIVCHASTVSFIKPCKLDDQSCLLRSSQAAVPFITAGIKDLGVDPLDPLVLDDVKTDEGGLKLGFTHLKVTGISKCIFTTLEMKDKSSLTFDVECPIVASGKYNVDGKVLILHAEGNGDFKIHTDKIKISLNAKLKTIDGSDGKKHWHLVSYEYSYEPIETVHYHFENLFNGNKELAQPVLDVLNNNWKDVLLSVAKPIIDEIVKKGKISIDQFLGAVPENELYL